MPLHDYVCNSCGRVEEIFVKLEELHKVQFCTYCKGYLKRQMPAPRVQMDYPAYNCPITGKRVDGKREHRENLERHGCRVLESGEVGDLEKRKKREEAQLEDKIADSAVNEFLKMPEHKRGMIAHELTHGAEAPIIRK